MLKKGFSINLPPKLNELKDGFFFLTGMYDNDTVELVVTPEGIVKNIVFVEELINSAPNIQGWKFTALKAALDIKDVNIDMNGYSFNREKISFYSNESVEYPDEIDITIVHNDFDEENKSLITTGTYIFLDNYIGELNFVTTIDNIKFISKNVAQKEKLKEFLIWRKKEFIEKCEGVMLYTETANHYILEAELKSGNKLIATINTDILNWENKASHPWILTVEIKYNGEDYNGMPDEDTYQLLDEIGNEILKELKDSDGFLNIGRQTADGVREIYFACEDFRKPSKVLNEVQKKYRQESELTYDIYIDKYWQSFKRFNSN